MELKTFSYTREHGWSEPFPALDSERTLVLAFGAPEFARDPAPLLELERAYPRSCRMACSTSGEIRGSQLVDESLSVAVMRFESTDLRAAATQLATPADSFAAGRELSLSLSKDDLRAIFVLSDGLGVNGSELVRGLNSEVGGRAVITGGLAGDGPRFQRTWVSAGDGPRSGQVCAVGLYGPSVRVGHGSRGGWDSFGPERTITRSRDNVLYELDGKPALALYKHYLGERAAGLPGTGLLFPMALRTEREGDKVLVRTLLAIDEAAQSITFAGNMPEGGLVRLMRANFERLIEGSAHAAESTAQAVGDARGDVLSIAISCVGRRLILGQRTEEEIEAALHGLPAGTQQIGFYSYGEISPFASGTCDLHNQTMTLTTLSES